MRDLDRIKEKVVIRLDNRQVALAIVGFIIVSTATFAGGVVVGKRMGEAVPTSLDELAGVAEPIELTSPDEHRGRNLMLARIAPGTQGVNAELMQPSEQIAVDNPTQAARIEAHRQIAAARAGGIARSLGPVAVGGQQPAPSQAAPQPFTLVSRDPERERAAMARGKQVASRYALQVSVFSSQGPAQVVADQLIQAGHQAGVRQIAQESTGTPVWRVEVGEFADAKRANEFQRKFERSSGYSTVLVPVR